MDVTVAEPAFPADGTMKFRIDDLIVDVERRRVLRAGVDLKLPGLSFDLLVVLTRAAPQVVTVRRLMDQVWPDLVVGPETVSQRVKLLRSALGDDAKHPRYVGGVRNRGYRVVATVTPLGPESRLPEAVPQALSRLNRSWGAAASFVLAAIVALAFDGSASRNAGRTSIDALPLLEPPSHSVAVLSFDNLDPNAPNDRSLAAGIAEDVVRALTDNPQSGVSARGASFDLNAQRDDLRGIARRLNVRYVLEGGLDSTGPQLRVRTSLFDATSGQNLWSFDFDRPSTQLPEVQNEIAGRLAEIVGVTINASADERRTTATTSNPEAYLEYLKARELADSYRLTDLRQASIHYSRALAIDSSFSEALSGLASARYQMLEFRSSNSTDKDWADIQAEVRQEVEKALALDSRNADAWQMLGAIEGDPERAEVYVRRAVALEPNSARVQFGLFQSVLSEVGRTAPARIGEAIALVQNAMRLDPREPRYPIALAEIYNFEDSTEIDKAEPLMRHALELDPNYFPALYALGALRFCCQNRIADGIRLAEQALKLDPTSTAVRSLLIHMYLDIGDLPAAEKLLANDNENQSAWLPIYAYRHEWQKVAALIYDDGTRANLPIPPDWRYGLLGVLMSSTDANSTRRALKLFERQTKIRWQADGTPTMGIPMDGDIDLEIGLADLMQRAGDRERARRVLEMALAVSQTAIATYHSGAMWFTLDRARALALLGRNQEALGELGAFSRSGWAPDAWLLDADTAFDGLRKDERFKQVVAERRINALRERAKVDALRSEKTIPQDLRWR